MHDPNRETKDEKAQRYLAQGRVLLTPARDTPLGPVPPGAIVYGDTGMYHVWFNEDGLTCECYAGTDHGAIWPPRCSHGVAAAIAWHEGG